MNEKTLFSTRSVALTYRRVGRQRDLVLYTSNWLRRITFNYQYQRIERED
jgi:hypothetical protein